MWLHSSHRLTSSNQKKLLEPMELSFHMLLSHVHVTLSRAVNELFLVRDIDYFARESEVWSRLVNFATIIDNIYTRYTI